MPAPSAPSSLRSVILPLLWPYRHWLLGAGAIQVIHGIAVSAQTLTPKWLIDDILNRPDISRERQWLLFAGLAVGYLLISLVFRMILWHVSYRIFTTVRERAVLTLRAQFFRHVNHLCLRFHGQHSSGELFSYLFGSPLGNIMQFYQHTSMFTGCAIVIVITTLVTTASWDPILTLVLTMSVFSSVWMMTRSRKAVQAISKDFQQTETKVVGEVNDLLRGNRAVKMYAMEEQIALSFEHQALQISKKSYERDVKSHMQWMKQEAFSYVAFIALLAAALWRYQSGAVTIGSVSAVILAFGALQGPLQSIFTTLTLWGSAQASIERIGEVLDASSSTPDPTPESPAVAVPPAGPLAFREVTFSYAEKPVLHQVTMTIPYGQRIAFVGPSGAGKSTISQLLMRLYDPDTGTVSIAGVDLRSLKGSDYRKRFGVVPQDPFIFRTTIRDNVRVASPEADDEAVKQALLLANAWEFVDQLPEKLDTRVGEGGSSLSGGQRQRLAIARALLANTPFFIFDEATSALDTLSEELIQRSLDTVLAGRTAILIAHRLATVKNCDRIVVMQDGRIAQDGSYDELVKQPGLFRDLVQGQMLRE
jgi:ABC-type multidrug transport system fused ATPase/permease subunit